jgi:hypothetical protein
MVWAGVYLHGAREYLRNAGRTGRFASDRFAKIWND